MIEQGIKHDPMNFWDSVKSRLGHRVFLSRRRTRGMKQSRSTIADYFADFFQTAYAPSFGVSPEVQSDTGCFNINLDMSFISMF